MARTLIRIFLETVATHHKPAQFLRKGTSGWESISADRALADVECLALGLAALGVVRGDHVAILSENRYEWAIADLAIMGLGAVTVPIYPTQTAAQSRFILADAGAKAVIVSTPEQHDKVVAELGALPQLTAILPIDPVPQAHAKDHAWKSVLERGAAIRAQDPAKFRATAEAVSPTDLATIIYTSGTTGTPKGAMLTHDNIAFDVESCRRVVALDEHDTCLSFLPLSHIFERMAGL